MAKEEGEVLDGRDLMVYIDVGSNPETRNMKRKLWPRRIP